MYGKSARNVCASICDDHFGQKIVAIGSKMYKERSFARGVPSNPYAYCFTLLNSRQMALPAITWWSQNNNLWHLDWLSRPRRHIYQCQTITVFAVTCRPVAICLSVKFNGACRRAVDDWSASVTFHELSSASSRLGLDWCQLHAGNQTHSRTSVCLRPNV